MDSNFHGLRNFLFFWILKFLDPLLSSVHIYVRLRSTSNPQIHVRFLRHRHLYLRSMSFLFRFSNWRPMTSLAYASKDITPVRSGFWSNDGEATRPDSRWRILNNDQKKEEKMEWAKAQIQKQSVWIFRTLQ